MKRNKPPSLKSLTPTKEPEHIIFSFKHYCGEDYLKGFQAKQISTLMSDFKELSQKTLKEAMLLRRDTNLGYEKMPCRQLKSYPERLPQDADIHVFRFANQNARLLCLHEEKTPILHVLVIDFDFRIYKH